MAIQSDRDVAEDHFIDKVPNWLRWVGFLPCALVASILGSMLFLFLISLFVKIDTGTLDGGWYRLLQSGILGAIFVYVGGFMAPKYQLSIAIALLVVLAVILTFIVSAALFVGGAGGNLWYQLLHSLAALIGGGVSLHALREAGAVFGVVDSKALVNDPTILTHSNINQAPNTLEEDQLVDWESIRK